MKELAAGFPAECVSIGQKVEYVSSVLLPAQRFEEYLSLMARLLDEDVHYVDPVHEIHGRDGVLRMLRAYVPRAANDRFRFELLDDTPELLVWRWTMVIRIRFGGYEFVINGLVHAKVNEGRIVYQREYYDPMESIGVIPLVGRLYKRLLLAG
jgi:limonene-1,2-epoxide hydrolase